jgi:hypothetical protein
MDAGLPLTKPHIPAEIDVRRDSNPCYPRRSWIARLSAQARRLVSVCSPKFRRLVEAAFASKALHNGPSGWQHSRGREQVREAASRCADRRGYASADG